MLRVFAAEHGRIKQPRPQAFEERSREADLPPGADGAYEPLAFPRCGQVEQKVVFVPARFEGSHDADAGFAFDERGVPRLGEQVDRTEPVAEVVHHPHAGHEVSDARCIHDDDPHGGKPDRMKGEREKPKKKRLNRRFRMRTAKLKLEIPDRRVPLDPAVSPFGDIGVFHEFRYIEPMVGDPQSIPIPFDEADIVRVLPERAGHHMKHPIPHDRVVQMPVPGEAGAHHKRFFRRSPGFAQCRLYRDENRQASLGSAGFPRGERRDRVCGTIFDRDGDKHRDGRARRVSLSSHTCLPEMPHSLDSPRSYRFRGEAATMSRSCRATMRVERRNRMPPVTTARDRGPGAENDFRRFPRGLPCIVIAGDRYLGQAQTSINPHRRNSAASSHPVEIAAMNSQIGGKIPNFPDERFSPSHRNCSVVRFHHSPSIRSACERNGFRRSQESERLGYTVDGWDERGNSAFNAESRAVFPDASRTALVIRLWSRCLRSRSAPARNAEQEHFLVTRRSGDDRSRIRYRPGSPRDPVSPMEKTVVPNAESIAGKSSSRKDSSPPAAFRPATAPWRTAGVHSPYHRLPSAASPQAYTPGRLVSMREFTVMPRRKAMPLSTARDVSGRTPTRKGRHRPGCFA